MTLSESQLLLFGGDHGGGSQRGLSYEPGDYLGDEWILTLPGNASGAASWAKVADRPTSSPGPGPRSLHTAVGLHGKLGSETVGKVVVAVVFGGLVSEAATAGGGATSVRNTDDLWLGWTAHGTQGEGVRVAWRRVDRGIEGHSVGASELGLSASPGASEQPPLQGSGAAAATLRRAGADGGPAGWPVARHGHASAVSAGPSRGDRALWVFGGSSHECPEGPRWEVSKSSASRGCALSDLWRLPLGSDGGDLMPLDATRWAAATAAGAEPRGASLTMRPWARMAAVGAGSRLRLPRQWPAPRSHGALVWAGASEGLILFGGARCNPSCTCLGDTLRAQWAQEEPGAVSWEGIARFDGDGGAACTGGTKDDGRPGCPAARYRHTAVADSAALQLAAAREGAPRSAAATAAVAMFGGEKYHPSAYFDDMWALSLPQPPRLRFQPFLGRRGGWTGWEAGPWTGWVLGGAAASACAAVVYVVWRRLPRGRRRHSA